MNMRSAIFAMLGAALLTAAPYAVAQLPTEGRTCAGTACRAQDAATIGGACFGNFCIGGGAGNTAGGCIGTECQAGNAGTIGGDCVGDKCKAGDARTSGGGCVGEGCRAGNARTSGGDCFGKGCQAGNGNTRGGDCYGEGCKPGSPRGRANPRSAAGPLNMGCCLAYYGAVMGQNTKMTAAPGLEGGGLKAFGQMPALYRWCAAAQRLMQGNQCMAYNRGQLVPVPPVPFVRPAKMPDPPTPLERLRPARDPRCKFSCQGWNPASNSCVGSPSNACD